jgi:2-desacetyl-2-hydroxyethyl bacteriochlorophyllide A dehydrogenase
VRALRLVASGRNREEKTLSDPVPGPGEIAIEVHAAGICHSDAHYRRDAGRARLPVTPGHEVAGIVTERGAGVASPAVGDRVAVHYLVGCGECRDCAAGGERFCARVAMIGKDRDGGYAERIVVPSKNAIPIPDEVSFDHAAVMMCSSATTLHALRLAELRRGETVLIVGFGGLGFSAVPLAFALGAGRVIAADVVPAKLGAARALGSDTIDASTEKVEEAVLAMTGGRGADVALDFAGAPGARLAALRSLACGGRLMLVALNAQPFPFDPYRDVLGKERRIVGCSDHLRSDLPELMELAREGKIDLSAAVTRTVPLEANAINGVLDELESGTSQLRTVIRPR